MRRVEVKHPWEGAAIRNLLFHDNRRWLLLERNSLLLLRLLLLLVLFENFLLVLKVTPWAYLVEKITKDFSKEGVLSYAFHDLKHDSLLHLLAGQFFIVVLGEDLI
jgi:hypothetical protein